MQIRLWKYIGESTRIQFSNMFYLGGSYPFGEDEWDGKDKAQWVIQCK